MPGGFGHNEVILEGIPGATKVGALDPLLLAPIPLAHVTLPPHSKTPHCINWDDTFFIFFFGNFYLSDYPLRIIK